MRIEGLVRAVFTAEAKLRRLGAARIPCGVGREGHAPIDEVAVKERTRFVHYTSSEAALQIIKTKRMWMRNATCMSDYREVQHGFQIVNKVLTENEKAFFEPLDASAPGAAQEAIALFNGWWNHIQVNTFITSMSEHDNAEDAHGRLSMWRAFGGGSARVAIVLRVPLVSGGATALNLVFSPVAYLTEDQTRSVMSKVIDNIGASSDFLRWLDRQMIGQPRHKSIIRKLEGMTNDSALVQGFWTVGQEARWAINWILRRDIDRDPASL